MHVDLDIEASTKSGINALKYVAMLKACFEW